MTQCVYIYKKGKLKDIQCNNQCQNGDLCPKHIPKKIKIDKSEEPLKDKIMSLPTTTDNKRVILRHYTNMKRLDSSSTEYYKNYMFVNTAISYPWTKTFDINNLMKNTSIKTFLYYLKLRFDQEIYGMDDVKNEIINYVCKMFTNPNSTRNNIALYGAAGVGKSKFIKVLSDILGLPLKIISLGGVKDSSFFLGHGYVYVESGPGKILQNIIDAKVSNPILYFDELDKVSETANGKDVYSFMSYLTDPTQNCNFTDHYFYDMKFDLSKVFYVFTFNDISKIDKVLLDRLNIIHIRTPTQEEICTILQNYCIKEIKSNIGISHHITLTSNQIKKIINIFKHNFDSSVSSGVREYYRIIEKVFLYINKDILMETIDINKTTQYITDIQLEYYLSFIQNQNLIHDNIQHIQHMYI